MKAPIYLRIGKGRDGIKVSASTKPNYALLTELEYTVGCYPTGRTNQVELPIPTTAFAILVEVPDAEFDKANEILAEVRIKKEDVKISELETKP